MSLKKNIEKLVKMDIFKFREIGILIPLIIISLFVGINKPVFFSFDVMINTMREASFIGIIAVGMTFVLIASGIDISVGSVLGLSGAVAAIFMVKIGLPVIPSIILGILVGTICGLIIGGTVVFLKIPPLIASLGMMYAARGMSLLITKGYPIVGLPKSFFFLGQGDILGIPFPIVFFILLAIIAHITLKYTKYGYWIKALGGNKDSARLSGLPIKKLELSVYLISSILAALAGIMVLSRISAAYAQTGRTWEMLVIAAVIIGGTSLFGGIGTIIGSVLGTIIIRTLNTSLVLLNINVNWQEIVVGCILVLAVALDAYQRRQQQKRLSRKALSTGEKKNIAKTGEKKNIAKTGEKKNIAKIELNKNILTDADNNCNDNVVSREPVLELNNITKYYGFVRALDNVSLTLYNQEVLGLVGDNGAGKSTLIKIASGALIPNKGTIKVFKDPVILNNPKDAQQHNIATVYQDLALIDCLDVVSNLFLGREPVKGIFVKRKKMLNDAKKMLARLRIDIPSLNMIVGNLSGGQRQVVAIAKAISLECKIIILDEPTAAIGVEQQETVLNLIKELKRQGCSVIVVSHNLYHIFSVCNRIAVLRDGRNVATFNKNETDPDEVISYITGSNLITV